MSRQNTILAIMLNQYSDRLIDNELKPLGCNVLWDRLEGHSLKRSG